MARQAPSPQQHGSGVAVRVHSPPLPEVHPLETFDDALCHSTALRKPTDIGAAKWLLAKALAGNSRKIRWARARAVILDPHAGTDDERLALGDFFAELDGLAIATVMRAARATPRQMAALFHAIGVRQWQAVLWVNQFSSRPHTPAMRYWDKFALGRLRFVDGRLAPLGVLGPGAGASLRSGCGG